MAAAEEYLLTGVVVENDDDDEEVNNGFDDEAMPWLLPAHILDEACGYRTIIDHHHHHHANDIYYSSSTTSKGRMVGQQRGKVNHIHNHPHGKLDRIRGQPLLPITPPKPMRTTKPFINGRHQQQQQHYHHNHHRHPRYVNHFNNNNGGGMRAIFLEKSTPNKSSSGTGVFLPRRADSGSDYKPIQKPPCSPVLLPSRVVQALNLNIHQLGLQLSPQRDLTTKHNGGGGGRGSSSPSPSPSSSSEEDRSGEYDKVVGAAVEEETNPIMMSSSPEVFLPKEWSY